MHTLIFTIPTPKYVPDGKIAFPVTIKQSLMTLNTFEKLHGSAKILNLSVIRIIRRLKKYSLHLYDPYIVQKAGRDEFKVFPCCHSNKESNHQLFSLPTSSLIFICNFLHEKESTIFTVFLYMKYYAPFQSPNSKITPVGKGPEEDHENDQKAGTPLL